MINIINVGYDSTNYYVVANPRPVLLIDLGFPETLPKLMHTTKRMGIELRHIPYLLCTHYHPDHAGAAGELQALGVRLIVVEEQRAFVDRLSTYIKPDLRFTPPRLPDAAFLTIDESRSFLAEIGLDGAILHTPGHSDDSVTLTLDQGAAFTGDLTAPTMASDDPVDPVVCSWYAIRAAGAATIYPGHGPIRPAR